MGLMKCGIKQMWQCIKVWSTETYVRFFIYSLAFKEPTHKCVQRKRVMHHEMKHAAGIWFFTH